MAQALQDIRNMPTIYMISGHLDLSPQEFVEHYVPAIKSALTDESDPRFVVGDAPGADALAQLWLLDRVQRSAVVVYHMLQRPRNNIGDYRTKYGYTTDALRDAAMTSASDHDIAWVRPGCHRSGTARNIARRLAAAQGTDTEEHY